MAAVTICSDFGGTRDQIANIHCIIKKAREFQNNIYFCFIDYAKSFDCHLTYLTFMPNQFSSVTESYLTLVDTMDCSMPGFHVHHQLPDLSQTLVRQVGDAIQPSHTVVPFSSCFQSFPASGSFQINQFFTSGGQSIGVPASVSVFPANIQD